MQATLQLDQIASKYQDLVIYTDGGSRGNPGVAGYGCVVYDSSTQEKLAEEYGFLGNATNNVAEYNGLIAGLKLANTINPNANITVKADSKLVVEQMNGRWKIKDQNLAKLVNQAFVLAGIGRLISYEWVPRSDNSVADALANKAMDLQESQIIFLINTSVISQVQPQLQAQDEDDDFSSSKIVLVNAIARFNNIALALETNVLLKNQLLRYGVKDLNLVYMCAGNDTEVDIRSFDLYEKAVVKVVDNIQTVYQAIKSGEYANKTVMIVSDDRIYGLLNKLLKNVNVVREAESMQILQYSRKDTQVITLNAKF